MRHGQSQGNVARDAADEAGAHEIDIEMCDVDVGKKVGPIGFLAREIADEIPLYCPAEALLAW